MRTGSSTSRERRERWSPWRSTFSGAAWAGIVAQVLGKGHPVPLEMVALDRYAESGKPEQLLEKYHLTPGDVAKAVKTVLARKRVP